MSHICLIHGAIIHQITAENNQTSTKFIGKLLEKIITANNNTKDIIIVHQPDLASTFLFIKDE
ncbi:MAG: hypothetical protein Q8S84_01335 [bacterium]|nr:hypothetical protein [bacterium]MDP3380216.1 hypothetical protein [bacterium]